MATDGLELVFKRLVTALDYRDFDSDELFSLADLDEDEVVTIGELISVFERLNLGLSRSDLKSIQTALETGDETSFSRSEFTLFIDRLKHGLKKQKLPSESLVSTQGKPTRKYHKIVGRAGAEEALSELIRNMESKGVGIMEVLDALEIGPRDKVSVAALSKALTTAYPHVSSEDIVKLMSFVDLDQNYEVNAFETFEFFNRYSKLMRYSVKASFRMIAEKIQEQSLDANAFCILHNITAPMPIGVFINAFCSLFGVSQEEAISLFTSLDTAKKGSVDVGKLVTVLDAYRPAGEALGGFFTMERVNAQESASSTSSVPPHSTDFNRILAKFNLTPSHVFQLADSKGVGTVQVQEIRKAVLKLVPDFPSEDLRGVMNLLPRTKVTAEEFQAAFPIASRVAEKSRIPETGIPLDLSSVDRTGLSVDQVYWIKKMDDTALLHSIALNTLFTAADYRKEDRVALSEFGQLLKKCIPQTDFSHADIASVVTALDIEHNGKIERRAFLQRIIDCRNSDFNRKLLEKYESEVLKRGKAAKPQQSSDLPLLQSSLKPPVISDIRLPASMDRRIKPLCIKGTSSFSPEFGALYSKLKLSMSSDLSNSLHILLPVESLLNVHRFKRMFKGGLTETELEALFFTTDTHSRSSIYLYQLLTVFDSFDTDMSRMPFPWNEHADSEARGLWSDACKHVQPKLVLHYAFGVNLRGFMTAAEWTAIIAGTQIPPQHQIMLKESLRGISGLKVYHVAALIQSFLSTYTLDVEQILHECVSSLDKEVAELFALRGLSPNDVLTKEKLLDELCAAVFLTPIEASILLKALYEGDNPTPLYHFFTYLDMAKSTYSNGIVSYQFPALPFASSQTLESGAFDLFRTMAFSFKSSVSDYGIHLTTVLNETEFVSVLNRATGVSPDELHIAFRLLKFNTATDIKTYHILTVLDSYKPQNLAFSFPKTVLSALYLKVPKTQTGITYVKSLTGEMDISVPQAQSDLELIFDLQTEDSRSMFVYLDSQDRGGVYLYEMATLIDLYIATGSMLGAFPFYQNPGTPQSIRAILTTIAMHLDQQKQSALQYFRASDSQVLEEACDRQSFARKLATEVTVAESGVLFDSLELRKAGFIRMYHLMACLETFCKRKLDMTFTADAAMT